MKISTLLPNFKFSALNESEHEGEAVEDAPPVGQMGEYITTAQAARMLGFRNPSRIRQLIAEKKLKTHHPVAGRRDNFLKQSEVQDYKSRMREEEKRDAENKKKTNEAIEINEARKSKKKKKKHKVRTWAVGTEVSWHYRSAIGHGTIVGVHKRGTSHATTEYSIREHDHHPGEAAIVYHYGKALTRA